MPIAGAAQGAANALEKILAEQMVKAQMAQRERENQQRVQMDQDRLTESTRQFNVRTDADERVRRDRINDRGLDLMKADKSEMDVTAAMDTLPPHLKPIAGLFKVGAVGKLSPEDLQSPEDRANALKADEERQIRIRRASQAPQQPKEPDYQRVVVDGKETFLTPDEVRARGGVDAASRKRASTGLERQALGFHNRMKDALDTMDSVEDALSERDIALINNSPLPDLINNKLLTGAGQQYAQALSTYTEARLRKESGAAIPTSEYETDRKTIGRQVGDQDDVRTQKRQTRRRTAEGVAYSSGPAYEEFYGEPFQRMQEFSVKAPNGKTYTFDTVEKLDAFKKKAGIQ